MKGAICAYELNPIARMFFELKGQLVLDFRVRIGLILGPICAIAFERIYTYFLSYAKVFLIVYIYIVAICASSLSGICLSNKRG